jgi:ketosteroid isomerase-like protein
LVDVTRRKASSALAGPATAAVVALALLVPGCGGSDPADSVRAYFEAIAEQDGGRACAQLTDELQAEIEEAPAVRAGGRTCADVMELAAGLNPSLTTSFADDLEVEVDEDDDQASAAFENPLIGEQETIDLVQVDGEWRISTLETRPTG